MPDRSFPDAPAPPIAAPTPIEIVLVRQPLVSIREALAISIHEVVNSPRTKRTVLDLYKVTRRLDDEAWLRRQLVRARYEAWVRAHL